MKGLSTERDLSVVSSGRSPGRYRPNRELRLRKAVHRTPVTRLCSNPTTPGYVRATYTRVSH